MSVGDLEIVSMHAISRQAEKQCLQLDTRFLQEVLGMIFEPIPRQNCQAVHQLRRYDVYHFRVNKTVRVSYARLDGQNCIVDVSVHKDFNAFACRYTGVLPEQLIPLEESTLMKKKLASMNTPANGNSQRSLDPSNTETQSKPINYELAGTLLDLIEKMCSETIDEQIAGKVLENEDRLQALEDSSAKQDGRFESLDTAVEKLSAAAKQLTGQQQRYEATLVRLQASSQQQQLQQTQTEEQLQQLAQWWQGQSQQSQQHAAILHRLELETAEQKQQALATTESLQSTHERLRAAQAETSASVDELSGKVRILQSANDELTKQNQLLQRQLSQLTTLHQAAVERADQLDQLAQNLSAEHTQRENELEVEVSRVAGLVAELQKRLAPVDRQIPMLESHINKLTQQVSSLETYREQLEDRDRQAAEKAAGRWWKRWLGSSRRSI